MEYDEIVALRDVNPAWSVLRADHAPFILGFLGEAFVAKRRREISGSDLESELDDYMWELNRQLGESAYPRSAKAYLEEWASESHGWLRRFYPQGSTEVVFDVTPALEKAWSFLDGLKAREFVGTASRLDTVFYLLDRMVSGGETDPQARLADLMRRRAEIDEQIERVSRGEVEVLSPTAQLDMYQQLTSTSRDLLADFREVEANLRVLGQLAQEQIMTWDGSKGDLLDDVMSTRASIEESSQGASFQAFYDYLMSPTQQEHLVTLMDRAAALIAEVAPAVVDPRMGTIRYDWADAAERTQNTVRQLSDRLRTFLDDHVRVENRRIVGLMRSIQANALAAKEFGWAPVSTTIADPAPTFGLAFERPLYTKPVPVHLDSAEVTVADAAEVDAEALFSQIFVDTFALRTNVEQELATRAQITLADLIQQYPVQQGVAEVVAYLSLTGAGFVVVFDETVRETVRWTDVDGRVTVVSLPRVTYARTGAGER